MESTSSRRRLDASSHRPFVIGADHPDPRWGRVHRAYRALLGEVDPAGPLIAEFGAVDLRSRWVVESPELGAAMSSGPVVVAGPNDLIELRVALERVTGPGSWPFTTAGSGPPGTVLTAAVVLERPAPVVALVAAMEHLIRDHSGAWRTWKTAREAIASGLADVHRLSLEAVVLDPGQIA